MDGFFAEPDEPDEQGDSDHTPQDEHIDTLADDLNYQEVKVG